MLDPRIDSIIYQSQIYYSNLINTLVASKSIGKANEKKWEKADVILAYLEALAQRDNLTDTDDIDNVNYILYCLISLCELNEYPISTPLTFAAAPAILTGIQGPPGTDGATGPQGPTGLASDFQAASITVSSSVDSFPITDAYGARWDYVVTSTTGARRTGSVLGIWNADGSQIASEDTSTEDIVGPTTGIEFNVQVLATDIRLVATITSGTWTIRGSRYFIPNNGNGSGPISDVLQDGYVLIGNNLNAATARLLSGAITITNTGVATLGANTVSNTNIVAGANIAINKLIPLTINSLITTDGVGVLTTISSPTLTEVSYLAGVVSPIQTQINLKISDPMTTIGDIIIRNGSNNTVRLAAGLDNQVLTIGSGVPQWVTGGLINSLANTRVPYATSATALTSNAGFTFNGVSLSVPKVLVSGALETGGGIRSIASGDYWNVILLDIGDWNMDSTSSKLVAHGLNITKIREVTAFIRNDANDRYEPINKTSLVDLSTPQGGILQVNSTNVNLGRLTGGDYDNTSYDSTSYNRGFIKITYIA